MNEVRTDCTFSVNRAGVWAVEAGLADFFGYFQIFARKVVDKSTNVCYNGFVWYIKCRSLGMLLFANEYCVKSYSPEMELAVRICKSI